MPKDGDHAVKIYGEHYLNLSIGAPHIMKKQQILPLLLILSLLMILTSCSKKSENTFPHKGRGDSEKSLLKENNIRKSGRVELQVKNSDEAKENIKSLVIMNNAQIINENISVLSDDRQDLSYTIKIPSDNFSSFLDSLSTIGKLMDLKIDADDRSSTVTENADRIDLIKSRIKKTKDKKRLHKLQDELDRLNRRKKNISQSILYSYIYINISESSSFASALSLVSNYGHEGMIWSIKISLFLLYISIPLVFLYIIIKAIKSLVKYRWNIFIKKVESLGVPKK